MTAAHRHLPLGSIVRVTCTETGRSVVVRINDRGPYIRGRVIDLSEGAAKRLGFHKDGLCHVRLEVLHHARTPPEQVAEAPESRDRL